MKSGSRIRNSGSVTELTSILLGLLVPELARLFSQASALPIHETLALVPEAEFVAKKARKEHE
jgi:hypothetical protein